MKLNMRLAGVILIALLAGAFFIGLIKNKSAPKAKPSRTPQTQQTTSSSLPATPKEPRKKAEDKNIGLIRLDNLELDKEISRLGLSIRSKVEAYFKAMPDKRGDQATCIDGYPFKYGIAHTLCSPNSRRVFTFWRGQGTTYDTAARRWLTPTLQDSGIISHYWLDDVNIVYSSLNAKKAFIFNTDTGEQTDLPIPAEILANGTHRLGDVVPVQNGLLFLIRVRGKSPAANDRLYLANRQKVIKSDLVSPFSNGFLRIESFSRDSKGRRFIFNVCKLLITADGPQYQKPGAWTCLDIQPNGSCQSFTINFPSAFKPDYVIPGELSGDGENLLFEYPPNLDQPIFREIFALNLRTKTVRQLTHGGGSYATMDQQGMLYFIGGLKPQKQAVLFALDTR